jgi:multicomponent Na+:H+ antiporter subunit D
MTGDTSPAPLLWLIALPLLGALLAFAFPRRSVAAGVGSGALLWIPLWVLIRQLVRDGEQRQELGGWAGWLGVTLEADGLSAFLLLMVTGVGSAVTCYAAAFFPSQPGAVNLRRQGSSWFWILWLVLWSALNTLFLARNLFHLYATLEVIGLSAIGLVALADKPIALKAAWRYLLANGLGSTSLLLGMAWVYAGHETLHLPQLRDVIPGPVMPFALAFMTAGLILKSALFPLHFWLPPAHANAPAPVSALLSALVGKGAFYLLLRLWFDLFPEAASRGGLTFLGAIGSAAVLWGSYQALRQTRLKRLVAYSTVSQVGYMFLLFPLSDGVSGGFTAWAGGLYFAFSHACAKAVMFLSAGNWIRAAGHDRVADLGETARAMPLTTFAFGLAAVSLIGLPPSGGFIAKWMLLNAALMDGQWWWVLVMSLGTLMAAAYFFRVLQLPFQHVLVVTPPARLPVLLEWTPLVLGLITIGLGFAASPLIWWLRVGAPLSGPVVGGAAL